MLPLFLIRLPLGFSSLCTCNRCEVADWIRNTKTISKDFVFEPGMMDRRDSQSESLTTLVFCEVIAELGAPASQKSAATSVCEEQKCASAYFYANCMQKRKKNQKTLSWNIRGHLSPLGVTEAVIICFINWLLNMDPMPRLEF